MGTEKGFCCRANDLEPTRDKEKVLNSNNNDTRGKKALKKLENNIYKSHKLMPISIRLLC